MKHNFLSRYIIPSFEKFDFIYFLLNYLSSIGKFCTKKREKNMQRKKNYMNLLFFGYIKKLNQ